MATLSVLKFNDPGGADRVLIALEGLQERQMITGLRAKRSPRPASLLAWAAREL
jgi:hypothetical protein